MEVPLASRLGNRVVSGDVRQVVRSQVSLLDDPGYIGDLEIVGDREVFPRHGGGN